MAVGDPALLQARAALLGLPLVLLPLNRRSPAGAHVPGTLRVLPVALAGDCRVGQLDPSMPLRRRHPAAGGGRLSAGVFSAMVTAPVQKSVINDGGIPFTGHTEFLAQATGTPRGW